MWSLLFILCIALSCGIRAEVVIRVSGYEKADIYMSCPYDKDYKSNKKYLCRNNCGNGDVLITTTDKKSDKYSAYDDKKERVFRAKISDLSSKDAGSYWCGVTKTGIDHYPARVELKVVPDSCCDQSTNFQSHETGSVSISCEYDSKYQNNLKYFCRGAQPSTCLQQALIMSNSSRDTRQFTLTDDQASRIFTVTITRLTLKDAGRYLCGIHKNANLDVFSAIELEVEVFQTTSFTSTIVVETVRSQTDPSEPRTDASLLSPLVLISIVVAVLMPPILISALIIVYKCKCDRAQDL
ncbi:CMRF35-like molecule 3 isoform X2 [Paralichthys olivaceus]|uniref:CMRF35-like molecule 3 isoform X2 n=1 Tax=Paralichthys olivaceus TaxID=8255 RepID=UPI0037529818